jgi:hypothetical protein
MAELTGSNLPLSENFRQQLAANTPCGASNQDAWPLTSPPDFIVTTGLCAQTLLGTQSYNTKTQVDLIKICNGSASECRSQNTVMATWPFGLGMCLLAERIISHLPRLC